MLRPWMNGALLACLLSVFAAKNTQDQEHTSTADDLIQWLKDSGAVVHLAVGPVNDAGLRGTIATKDIAEGESIVVLPNNLTIDIADYRMPGAELAVALYRRQLLAPAWNASFGPYWASLPLQGMLYSKEVWNVDPAHLDLLQDDYMAQYAGTNGNWTVAVFDGTAGLEPERMFPDLLAQQVPGADAVTLDEFRHWAALAATYSFVFPDAQEQHVRVFLPLLDLCNHAGEAANSAVNKNTITGAYYLSALRAIRKGEEVMHTYNWDNERSDYSLVNYFFLGGVDPPRLCALDLPGGHLDGGFGEVDDHYLPRDKGSIQEYVAWLETRLAGFPTTEEEDGKLLAAEGGGMDWRDRRVVQFRRERKRAIRLTLQRLREREKTAYRLLSTPAVAREEL